MPNNVGGSRDFKTSPAERPIHLASLTDKPGAIRKSEGAVRIEDRSVAETKAMAVAVAVVARHIAENIDSSVGSFRKR